MGSPTQTTNYNLYKPIVGEESTPLQWGEYVNTNFDTIDSQMKLEETYASGIGAGIVATNLQVNTNTSNISTNTSNITGVTNYASGVNDLITVPFNYNYERPPFNAVRVELGSGLNTEQYLTVTEGFDETATKTYVQVFSSGLAYQEHLDMYITKVFPKGADFGSGNISIDYDMDSTSSDDNKIIATVYKNGVAETPETIVKPADHSFTSEITSYNSNLRHVWHFESTGNESDSIGSATLTAVAPSGTIDRVDGEYNYARQLTASNEQYFSGYPTYIMSHNGSFTINMLCKFNSEPTTRYLISKTRNDMGGDAPIWTIYIYKSGSNYIVNFVVCDEFGSSSNTTITLAGGNPNGKWYMITGRFDGSNIYLDAGDISAGTTQNNSSAFGGSTQWDMDTSGFYVGCFYFDGMNTQNPFDGIIDEYYYWDDKISDTAVSDLFYAGILRFYGYSGGSGSPYTMTNIGSGWTFEDELILKTELWSKDNNAVKLYGINFDIG